MTITRAGETTLGRNLKLARDAKGISLNELAFRIRPYLSEQDWVTGEAIRRYELDMVRKVNYGLLVAIGEVLGVSLNELSPALADEAKTLRDLLIASLHCSSPSVRNSDEGVYSAAVA